MNNILLRKVREDDTKERELFEELYLNFGNSLFSLLDDSSDGRELEEILYEYGFINESTQEEIAKFDEQCIKELKTHISKTYFVIFNDKVVGYITADLGGTRSVMTIIDIGFVGCFLPTNEEISDVIDLAVKQFRKIKIARIMNTGNQRTIARLKAIGFHELKCCLEKKIGGG